MSDKILFVDLADQKTKKVAKSITSVMSRQIMELLAHKKMSATQVAAALDVGLTKVHYHLQNLTDAGLVVSKEFTYSEKGREIHHYQLASKYIIISPIVHESIKEKLQHVLPIGLLFAGVSVVLRFIEKSMSVVPVAARRTADVALESEAVIQKAALTQQVVSASEPSIALWFFLGSVGALLLYVLYMSVREFVMFKNS